MAQNKRNAPAKSNMKPFYIVLAVVAVAGIGAIVYSMRGSGTMCDDSSSKTRR